MGCGKLENQDTILKPYPIEIVSSNNLTKEFELVKKWIVVWQETITVTSKVPWRIGSIDLKLGEEVEQWERVVVLQDAMWTMSTMYERAKAWLLSAQSSYDTAYANLQKSLNDTFASYQFARSQLERAKIDAERQKLQIELDLASKTINGTGSLAARQLETLQKQIESARFDLTTKQTADQQTLNWYITSYENLTRDLAVVFEEVTSMVDELYWVTIINQQAAQQIRSYVSARNTNLYTQWRNALLEALTYLTRVQEEKWTSTTPQNLATDLSRAQSSLSRLRDLLEVTKLVLNNSVTWPNFTQWQIDGYVVRVTGLQTKVQAIATAVTQQKNAISWFLATYELQQQSLQNTIALLEQQRDTTRATLELNQETMRLWSQRQVSGIESQLDSVQLQATTTESTYEVVRSTKDSTVGALAAALQNAQASYNEAKIQREQLNVTSPISGIIDKILVDRGQDVTPWNPLFVVSNNKEPKITLSLSSEELRYITLGQTLDVILSDGIIMSWTIVAIAQSADKYLMYSAEIAVDWLVPLLWDIVTLRIPLKVKYPLLPLQIVTLRSAQRWEIQTYTNWEIKTIPVTLWKVWWNKVEIIEGLPWLTNIIITPLQSFDPNLFKITLY
jgi:multidrug resistance efflux pump